MAEIDDVRAALRSQPRTWLVTGPAGFIGSHLLEHLLDLGQRVVGLDNFSTGTAANLEAVKRRVGASQWSAFDLIRGDIRDGAACAEAVRGVDHVLHQAALGSVPRSIDDPRATHETNVDGFGNIVLAGRDAGCRSFVYASSSSVYGDSADLPKRELQTGRPLSPYAASKVCNEAMAAAYGSVYDLSLTGLRYFNVIGPRQDPQGPYAAVVPRWIAQFLAGERPTIFGDGSSSRDFCPIANVVQANLLAATKPAPGARVYNVALGRSTTLERLFMALRDQVAQHRPQVSTLAPRYAPSRPGDIAHSLADISLVANELGYQPEMDLEDGLEQTVESFTNGT